ncbi:hypothetical protein BJ138DRAFT_361008 [Hygrophoropsis aurantiaca]|uniref:Uncharacterized protein n=1 Tax=Hygrophoropsis aurantiaca TaxID=72124 RepID=A0ACB8A5L5_9AGAM|nr:hypothetical protein BJ138DRAFT_361008 [Hygrophoropsis aurantiaca]
MLYYMKVYRYKAVYFTELNIFDDDEDGDDSSTMGLEMLQFARIGDFKALHAELDMLLATETYADGFSFGIAKNRPRNSTSSDYMFELDFDRGVFHAHGQPFYRLDNLPSDEFLPGHSLDNFGNRCPRRECPREHMYEWKAAPPVIDLTALRARVPHIHGIELQVHDILGVPIQLSDRETTRKRLLEVIIAKYLSNEDISPLVREFESFAGPDQIPDDTWKMAFSMVNFSFMVQVFPQRYVNYHKRMEFAWVRRDVVAHVTTHLDDAVALQAAILRIVYFCVKDEEIGEMRPRVVFGVASSVNHCAIVRVLKANDGTISFQHTPALQFVPSFFADSPSTPGMTALARLAHRPDPDMVQRALGWNCGRDIFWATSFMSHRPPGGLNIPHDTSNLNNYRLDRKNNVRHPLDQNSASVVVHSASSFKSAAERVPLEIWMQIASLIDDIASLIDLGMVSRVCAHAACSVLQHPHIVLQAKDETHGPGLICLTKAMPYSERFNLCYAEFDGVYESKEVRIKMGLYGFEFKLCFDYSLYYGDSISRGEDQGSYWQGPRMTFLVTAPPPLL